MVAGMIWDIDELINKFFNLLSSLSIVSNSNGHDVIQAMDINHQVYEPCIIPSTVHFQNKRLAFTTTVTATEIETGNFAENKTERGLSSS